jgi:hypothetical protein
MLQDINECLDQARQPDQLTHTAKQYLLAKVTNLSRRKGPSRLGSNKDFETLLTDISENFSKREYTPHARESVVSNLAKLGILDEEIFGQTVELIKKNQFKNMNTLTNVLHACAKLKYVHRDQEGRVDNSWVEQAMD